MKLKATLNTLEGLDDAFHGLYTKVGDTYVLDVDDTDYKTKVDEFRNTNIDLRQQIEKASGNDEELEKLRNIAKQFDGIDPEKARLAQEALQSIEDKKMIDAGRIDELVETRTEQRVQTLRSDLEGQITALTTDRDKYKTNSEASMGQLNARIIDGDLKTAITDVGKLRKGALGDALSRGKSVWALNEEGTPVATVDGEVVYGKDGKSPITMNEWAGQLAFDAPHLFEGNVGGGAGGNQDGGFSKGVVSANDQDALSNNLEAIAAGDVQVIQD